MLQSRLPHASLPNQGDAHWTQDKNLALCIRTADCLPILFYSSRDKIVAALHAGWRGVANNIIQQLFLQLSAHGYSSHEFQAWVGPHISAQTFEVGIDVANQLESAWQVARPKNPVRSPILAHPLSEKRYVNLALIVREQLLQVGLKPEAIQKSAIDTFTHENFYSYRRNQTQQRQISFYLYD